MSFITAHHIVKTYAGHQALAGLDAEIPQGKITGLLGPNGAGKTTFIRILNRIILADSGELHFNGQLLTNEQVQKIGYLPEERGLYKKMRVKEQLLYLARLKEVPASEAIKNIDHWLEKMDLKKWQNANLEKLSKGMQQKVQFIAAILHDPDFIILDEPFTGFDPVNAEVIRKEILELKAKGKTILLSTHRMDSVEELCDHIILIHNARNVLTGELKELKQQFKEEVFEFRGEGKLPIIPFDIKKVEQQEEGYILRVQLKGDELKKTIELLNAQTTLTGVKEVLPSMHDVFFKIVGKDE